MAETFKFLSGDERNYGWTIFEGRSSSQDDVQGSLDENPNLKVENVLLDLPGRKIVNNERRISRVYL